MLHSADIFLAKAVSQNEVIHANAKDIDSIFKLQVWNENSSNKNGENLEEIKARVAKIKTDIELEEKMQQAAEKILGVTTDAQKIAVIDQIDSSNKRLRALKHELEKLSPLVSDSRALSPSDSKDVSKIITYMCISLCGVTELYLF